jgi:hypothetical protein
MHGVVCSSKIISPTPHKVRTVAVKLFCRKRHNQDLVMNAKKTKVVKHAEAVENVNDVNIEESTKDLSGAHEILSVDPFAPRTGVTLSWQNVSMVLVGVDGNTLSLDSCTVLIQLKSSCYFVLVLAAERKRKG